MTSVKGTNYFPHIGMKLLFAFTSASIKGLIEFVALAEGRASAWVLLTSNDRQYLSVTSDHNSHLKKMMFLKHLGQHKNKNRTQVGTVG